MAQPSIFISYSHVDEEWKDRLVKQLRVLQLEGAFDVWDDRRIQTGDDWYPEIKAAINKASLAVLLISEDFLISNFIRKEEVPHLLERRQQEGMHIFPVILWPCLWQRVKWLSPIQVRPKDGRPLASGSEYEIRETLANIALEIADTLQATAAPSPPPIPPLPVSDPAQQLAAYLQTVTGRCTRLQLGPLDPTGRESARITLEQVYVGLDIKTPQSVTFEGQKGEVRSVLATVANQQRLAILGDPGSGKSTFLRYLALRLAQARLNEEGDWLSYLRWPVYPVEQKREAMLRDEADKPLGHIPWPHPPYVPILVTLRDFAAADFDPASPMALWNFIQADLAERGLADTISAVWDALRRGEGILLLDGVDEVSLNRRSQVWQAIGALTESAFNQCPWVATCRILSYVETEATIAGATGRVTLAPLKPAQIEQFVEGWYEALIAGGQVTRTKGKSLREQLGRAATGRLRELAQNPMLLTIMALVQTYYGTLPEERAKLYQACVDTLLLRWQQSKEAEAQQLPALLTQLEVKQETLERLLWEIGWAAHAGQATRQGAADISEEEIIQLAKKHLGSYAKAEAFVEYTERRAHLLIGQGGQADRRYSFPHRTFQEYLAGCHLANDRRFGRKAIPLAEAGAPWREVLLLAAGTLVYNQKVGRYVLDALEDILPPDQPAPGDAPGWQRVWRAGEMLAIVGLAEAEADEVGREILPRTRQYLAALLTGGELTPPERAEAGQALAALDDPRPGVGLLSPPPHAEEEPGPALSKVEGVRAALPDIHWRPVEAGEFIMGDDEGDDDEKPAHPVTLAAFEISQYPITNVQFQAFVAAGGYEQEGYWPEAKAVGYRQEGKFKGRGDSEPRDRPYDFGSPFNLPNHPVVGVNWYEAVAFCRWLSEQLGHPVRLPTEAEWEKAARGADGRQYPWGNQAEVAGQCNMADTGIGATCAVGIFPAGASPYDVFDMSGNVWEWCSTIWEKEAYPFRVTDEWTLDYLGKDVLRVLRGGAFYSNTGRVRCASRYWGLPDLGHFGVGLLGFRVVRPPSF